MLSFSHASATLVSDGLACSNVRFLRRPHVKQSWQQVLLVLDHEHKLDLSLGNMDGTLVQAPQYAGVGYDSPHKRYGTKVSLRTEREGVPLTCMTFKGNRQRHCRSESHHEQTSGWS
jgi:hypothetical protein